MIKRYFSQSYQVRKAPNRVRSNKIASLFFNRDNRNSLVVQIPSFQPQEYLLGKIPVQYTINRSLTLALGICFTAVHHFTRKLISQTSWDIPKLISRHQSIRPLHNNCDVPRNPFLTRFLQSMQSNQFLAPHPCLFLFCSTTYTQPSLVSLLACWRSSLENLHSSTSRQQNSVTWSSLAKPTFTSRYYLIISYDDIYSRKTR